MPPAAYLDPSNSRHKWTEMCIYTHFCLILGHFVLCISLLFCLQPTVNELEVPTCPKSRLNFQYIILPVTVLLVSKSCSGETVKKLCHLNFACIKPTRLKICFNLETFFKKSCLMIFGTRNIIKDIWKKNNSQEIWVTKQALYTIAAPGHLCENMS